MWKLNPNFCYNMSYDMRLDNLKLLSLANRRKVAAALFVADLMSGRSDAPNILERVHMNVNSYRSVLRNRKFLTVEYHRTNYGKSEPINRMFSEFNDVADLFDFNKSRDVFKHMLQNYYLNEM